MGRNLKKGDKNWPGGTIWLQNSHKWHHRHHHYYDRWGGGGGKVNGNDREAENFSVAFLIERLGKISNELATQQCD